MESTDRQAWNDALRFITEEMKCDRALVLANRPEGDPEVMGAHGVDPDTVWTIGEVSHDILRRAARGESILLSDATADPRFGERSSVVLSSLRSILCLPVKAGDQVLGVLYADSQIRTGIFGRKDKKKLEEYAASLAGRLGG